MQYSNLGIVTNVVLPYNSKDDTRDLEQKQLSQQQIQPTSASSTTNNSSNSNTNTNSNTELPDDKNPAADILLSESFKQATFPFSDYSSMYIHSFSHHQ